MDAIFLQVLNMSLTASYVILVVSIVRKLLKKAPKIFSYALWSAVLFRLICPFSIESFFSLISMNTNPLPVNILYASINPIQLSILFGEFIWVVGFSIWLVYSILSLLRLRNKLVGAVKLRDNIYLADHIATPFVIGVLHPKIYLPSTLSEQEQKYIILHEQTHVLRYDHIIKIIAFLALAIHWFNPLVWLAFILCTKDMEMSCDESVMKQIDTDIRKEYSASLLSLTTGKKIISGAPLAFGEGDTKARIKNVMNYKKTKTWIAAVSMVIVVLFCVGFTTNPVNNESGKNSLGNEKTDITVNFSVQISESLDRAVRTNVLKEKEVK